MCAATPLGLPRFGEVAGEQLHYRDVPRTVGFDVRCKVVVWLSQSSMTAAAAPQLPIWQ